MYNINLHAYLRIVPAVPLSGQLPDGHHAQNIVAWGPQSSDPLLHLGVEYKRPIHPEPTSAG